MWRWITALVLGVALAGCGKPSTTPPEGVDSDDLKLDVDMGTETKPGDLEKSDESNGDSKKESNEDSASKSGAE